MGIKFVDATGKVILMETEQGLVATDSKVAEKLQLPLVTEAKEEETDE